MTKNQAQLLYVALYQTTAANHIARVVDNCQRDGELQIDMLKRQLEAALRTLWSIGRVLGDAFPDVGDKVDSLIVEQGDFNPANVRMHYSLD
jgi:hypothetical protein